MIHFHSSDPRFCGATEKPRQFTVNADNVTCGACAQGIRTYITPQGEEALTEVTP